MGDAQAQVPLSVRLLLGRGAAQLLADEAGADILHIKGDAVADEFGLDGGSGSDVDVLVRPAHVDRLHAVLIAHGWTVYSTFTYGSPFGHAQTYVHGIWGYLDLHRLFPGIRRDAALAFDTLWEGRMTASFADVAVSVPSLTGQRLILLLNAARSPRPGVVQTLWTDAAGPDRAAVTALADVLDARVALAAATGDLERFRTDRAYALWRVISQGGSRSEEWRARIHAAPTRREQLEIALRAPLVNVEHLEHRLGRAPTTAEIVREFFARPLAAARDVVGRKGRG
jgi:hypothetical protein